MGQESNNTKVVLVVEDESVIRMLLTDDLEEAGYMVQEAVNADVAIKVMVDDLHIDAVVTDVRMPGSIDGIGLAAWIHQNRRRVPVVITSGYLRQDEAKGAHPEATVISKPYLPADVTALLKQLIGDPKLQ